jgi:ADP-ribosylglycohydrolase
VDVLMRVYAKCVARQQDEAKRRVLEATKSTHERRKRDTVN